jgi:large subunit ribosomal protein L29
MKTSDIRKMSVEDINSKIIEIKNELFELRMKQATGSLDKPHMINAKRKDVARLKTVLTEKLSENDGSDK